MVNDDVILTLLLCFFSVVPNHCWYRGHKYDCGVSLGCVFSGKKALDLCNGGMVWSCCVPRSMIDGERDIDDYSSASESSGGGGSSDYSDSGPSGGGGYDDDYGTVNNASEDSK
jgi:hypothetical protein